MKGKGMYKFKVTKELARLLKEKRLSKGIKAKSFSEIICLNAAHISKIENGLIRSISHDTLCIWLQKLYGKEDYVSRIYDSLRYWYSRKDISRQLWFTDLDFGRGVSLTPIVVGYLNGLMKNASLAIESLYYEMSHNSVVEESELSKKESDEWYFLSEKYPYPKYMKLNISFGRLTDILEDRVRTLRYCELFWILFYINSRILIKKVGTSLHSEEFQTVFEYTEKQLAGWGISSVSYLKSNSSDKIKSVSEKESIAGLNEINDIFRNASEQDSRLVSERLNAFRDSLKWDVGFMLKLVSLDYKTNLDTFSKRKRLLEVIEQTVKEFQESVKNTTRSSNLSDY